MVPRFMIALSPLDSGRFSMGEGVMEFEIRPDYTVEDFAALLAGKTGKPAGWVNDRTEAERKGAAE